MSSEQQDPGLLREVRDLTVGFRYLNPTYSKDIKYLSPFLFD